MNGAAGRLCRPSAGSAGPAALATDADTGDTDPTTGDPGGDEVTEYDVEPGILASAPKPGFCEPELYTKDVDGVTEYWLRDVVQGYAMLGYIVGDGFHWWTEQVRRGDDPNKLGTGDGDPQWEPKEPGTPPPWTWSDNPNGDGAYPRMHEYALSYGKLGQYRAKQVEDRLGSWSFAAYTLDGGPGSVPSGDMTILELAEGRLPIVLLLGEPGARAVFAVHPFGDYRRRYTLEVDVDGAPTIVTISGKWPTLVRR